MKKFLKYIICILAVILTLTSCMSDIAYIGVQSGTTGQYFVDGDEDWEFVGISGYQSKKYDNGGLAVTDMKHGAVRYVMLDEQPAKLLQQKIPGIKVIDIPLTNEEYAFGVDKGQPGLHAEVNRILREMKEKGEIDRIVAAYATGSGINPITSAIKDEARADEQLVVSTNAAFAPFEYKDGDKYAGIDMEIAAYIASELNMELVIENMDFTAVVESVGSHCVDIAMAGLTVNEKRKEHVNFTDSYYNAAQMLMVLSGDDTFDKCTSAEEVISLLEKNADKPYSATTEKASFFDSWDSFRQQFFTKGAYKTVLSGLLATVEIAVFGLIIGIIFGTLIAFVKVLPRGRRIVTALNVICDIYVGFFRGTPMVVQLLIGYFVLLPALGIVVSNAVLVAVIIFGLNSAAYVSEIMRAGINSVDKGQLEAARAVGLPFWQSMIKIIVPQSVKNILPTLGNEFIVLIKETSIVSFIAVTDLTKAFREIGDANYDYIVPYLMLAAVYLVLVVGITIGVKFIERRLAKNGR